jgi:hypothetical protein
VKLCFAHLRRPSAKRQAQDHPSGEFAPSRGPRGIIISLSKCRGQGVGPGLFIYAEVLLFCDRLSIGILSHGILSVLSCL